MSYPVNKDFVIGRDCDLNHLLYKLTGLENLVSSYDLSMNFAGDFVCDKATAETKVRACKLSAHCLFSFIGERWISIFLNTLYEEFAYVCTYMFIVVHMCLYSLLKNINILKWMFAPVVNLQNKKKPMVLCLNVIKRIRPVLNLPTEYGGKRPRK